MEYLQQRFPESVAKAREFGAEIYFVDEAAMHSDAHRGSTWGVVGATPRVEISGWQFGLALIGAVSPRGLIRFSFIVEPMISTRFIDFLTKLRRDAGQPLLVILDNASYHHSRETRRFLAEQGGQIQVLALPAYSPEPNLDEQVWNCLNGRLAVRPILSKEEMKRRVRSILRSIQERVALVKSFFRLPDTNYVLEAIA
jgi:transposase